MRDDQELDWLLQEGYELETLLALDQETIAEILTEVRGKYNPPRVVREEFSANKSSIMANCLNGEERINPRCGYCKNTRHGVTGLP